MNFNLRNSSAFKAILLERNPIFGWANVLKKIFFIIFILSLFLFAYGFLLIKFSNEFLSKLLGVISISFVISLSFYLLDAFFNSEIKKVRPKAGLKEVIDRIDDYNLADFIDFRVAKVIYKAKENTNKILYFAIVQNPELDFLFHRLLLDKKLVKKLAFSQQESDSGEFEKTIISSLKAAQRMERPLIGIYELMIGLAENNPLFKSILIEKGIRIKDLENLIFWQEALERKIEIRKRWWDYRNLMRRGTLAKEWTAGYTIALDRYSLDWSEILKRRGFPEVIGHKDEIAQVERVLSRSEINNVLLVGEAGTGRKSIVEALASKSFLGISLPELNYKRFVELKISEILGQVDRMELEGLLDQIFREVVSAGNVVLIIDEFHNFVGGKERMGAVDISGVLSPYLNFPQFQIIAITTFEGLHKSIEQNPSLLNLFEKVEVTEVSPEETLRLLEQRALFKETKHKIFFSYQALRDIVEHCQRFLPALPFPEKALDILEEVSVSVAVSGEKIVLPKHVAKIVSEKSQIPVGELEAKEKDILLNLEDLIHQRIIDQEEAVKEVSSALRRARAEVTVRKGPMGTFLFLGPTGVGKTETSKALAEIYFGSEDKMIRLDMSEFQNVSDIPRLLGSPGEEGILTTQVRDNPFSLILLDEIEKAHPNILNLFLQVLDEGHLTDGLGRKVDFKSSIIIATSNAGYKIILQAIKDNLDFSQIKGRLLSNLFSEGIFRPEFINRFDAVVIFRPLSKENLLDIAELLLQKLKKNLAQKGIDFVITSALKEKIVELGYDPTFGARQMRRVIQDKVENILARAILEGRLTRGSRAEINPDNFSLA